MKTKFRQKTWYSNDDAEKDLEVVMSSIGDGNESQAIRYALKQVARKAKKESLA